MLVPPSFNMAACNLSFDLSYGATASITAGSTVNITAGEYLLNVTSQDSLNAKQWKIVVTKQQTTGMEDLSPSTQVLVYPNPSNGTIWFESKQDIVTYSITDLSGREHKLGSAVPHQSIDISALANGMYFLSLVDAAGGKLVVKLLKE
jgi:hypothetical protein